MGHSSIIIGIVNANTSTVEKVYTCRLTGRKGGITTMAVTIGKDNTQLWSRC